MAGWRLALRELADRGGSATMREMEMSARTIHFGYVTQCVAWGFVTGPGRHGKDAQQPYHLTPLGWKAATNRIAPMVLTKQTGRGSPGYSHFRSRKFVATWLSALPDTNTVRINLGDHWVP